MAARRTACGSCACRAGVRARGSPTCRTSAGSGRARRVRGACATYDGAWHCRPPCVDSPITLADADRGVYERSISASRSIRPRARGTSSHACSLVRSSTRRPRVQQGWGLRRRANPRWSSAICAAISRASIEVGSPTPTGLHKATKASPRVVVYTWKRPRSALAGRSPSPPRRRTRAGRARIQLARSRRRGDGRSVNTWDLSVTGGAIYLTVGDNLSRPESVAARPGRAEAVEPDPPMRNHRARSAN